MPNIADASNSDDSDEDKDKDMRFWENRNASVLAAVNAETESKHIAEEHGK